jgi:hypothetical protein
VAKVALKWTDRKKIQPQSPTMDIRGVVQEMIGVSAVPSIAPSIVLHPVEILKDMDYLWLEDNSSGKVPAQAAGMAPPPVSSSDIRTLLHYSQVVPYESSASKGDHCALLHYSRVDNTSCGKKIVLRSEVKKLMFACVSLISPNIEKVGDFDDSFGSISPLERSLQCGCMDVKRYLPSFSNDNIDVRMKSKFGV